MWKWIPALVSVLAGCGRTATCAFSKTDEAKERCESEYESQQRSEARERDQREADRQTNQRDRDAYRTSIEPCKRRDPQACMHVAAYRIRHDHPAAEIDPALRVACDGNIGIACYLVGERANLLPAKLASFLRACELQHALGCHEAATLEPARRIELDTRACDLREYAACERLGVAHLEGRGVPVDRDMAALLLRIACDQGRKVACGRLSALGPEPR